MSDFLLFDKVFKAYETQKGKKNVVFEDFSLKILKSNHLLCLTGPDGAGKSTFLKMLSGLIKPDRGEVRLLGERCDIKNTAFTSKIGYMSQTLGLYKDMTVYENLCLISGLKGFDLKNNQQYLIDLLKKIDLFRFKDYAAGSLSGGMKQKLALTCALSCNPQVLILDEPTVGVDPVSRIDLWEIISDYLKKPSGFCSFTTAYLEEAQQADEVLMFNEGSIIKNDSPKKLLSLCEGKTYALKLFNLNYQHYARSMMFKTKSYVKNSPIIDVCPREGNIDLLLDESASYEQLRDFLKQNYPDDYKNFQVNKRPCILEDVYINETQDHKSSAPKVPEHIDFLKNSQDLSQTVIDVCDIKKVFGKFAAVEKSNFKVHKGEIFGLLGPNGAGKTTTFRMICALLSPTSGHVLVNGFDLRYAKSGARATIGYVSQKFSLYRSLTTYQNLEYFGRSYGLYGSYLKERIFELLEDFSLKKYLNVQAGSLPFGIQRQLSMACALIHKPKILFLDEATSGADPKARRNFWNRINILSAQGTSIIVTTHFMEEAEYCDRFLIQDHGKILVLGPPDEICKQDGKRISVMHAFIKKVHEFRKNLEEDK